MDIETLRSFVLLAQCKSFSKTAELQHVVQSTVTARIQETERLIGKNLFLRNNRKVEITKAGEVFLSYADRIVKQYDESIVKLSTLNLFEDYLVIGSVDSIWRFTLYPILHKFLIDHPQIAVKGKTWHSGEIINYLVDNLIDLGFVYMPPRLPILEVIPCLEDEIILVANPKHNIAKKSAINVKDLPGAGLLYLNWSGPFQEWISHVFPSGFRFKFEMDPASLLLPLVEEGVGPALVTRETVKDRILLGKLVEIPVCSDLPLPKWKIYAVFQKSKRDYPAIQKWFKLMRENGFNV